MLKIAVLSPSEEIFEDYVAEVQRVGEKYYCIMKLSDTDDQTFDMVEYADN